MAQNPGREGRGCSTCGHNYQPKTSRQRHCSTSCRDRMLGRRKRARRGTTTQAGYGYEHQQERARWKPYVEAGGVSCWRCDQPIIPGTRWDLGHDDYDRTQYRGPEHADRCNRSAGAAKGNRQRAQAGTSTVPRIAR